MRGVAWWVPVGERMRPVFDSGSNDSGGGGGGGGPSPSGRSMADVIADSRGRAGTSGSSGWSSVPTPPSRPSGGSGGSGFRPSGSASYSGNDSQGRRTYGGNSGSGGSGGSSGGSAPPASSGRGLVADAPLRSAMLTARPAANPMAPGNVPLPPSRAAAIAAGSRTARLDEEYLADLTEARAAVDGFDNIDRFDPAARDVLARDAIVINNMRNGADLLAANNGLTVEGDPTARQTAEIIGQGMDAADIGNTGLENVGNAIAGWMGAGQKVSGNEVYRSPDNPFAVVDIVDRPAAQADWTLDLLGIGPVNMGLGIVSPAIPAAIGVARGIRDRNPMSAVASAAGAFVPGVGTVAAGLDRFGMTGGLSGPGRLPSGAFADAGPTPGQVVMGDYVGDIQFAGDNAQPADGGVEAADTGRTRGLMSSGGATGNPLNANRDLIEDNDSGSDGGLAEAGGRDPVAAAGPEVRPTTTRPVTSDPTTTASAAGTVGIGMQGTGNPAGRRIVAPTPGDWSNIRYRWNPQTRRVEPVPVV